MRRPPRRPPERDRVQGATFDTPAGPVDFEVVRAPPRVGYVVPMSQDVIMQLHNRVVAAEAEVASLRRIKAFICDKLGLLNIFESVDGKFGYDGTFTTNAGNEFAVAAGLKNREPAPAEDAVDVLEATRGSRDRATSEAMAGECVVNTDVGVVREKMPDGSFRAHTVLPMDVPSFADGDEPAAEGDAP